MNLDRTVPQAARASLMHVISLRGVSRTFRSAHGDTLALQHTDFDVQENDFVTILGPSGCGKSTMLRIVAGLDHPTSGEVLQDGKRISGPGPGRGMVFQSYTLFPWLTVHENVCFGLRERGMPRPEQDDIARDFIDRVGLSGFERHWPHDHRQPGAAGHRPDHLRHHRHRADRAGERHGFQVGQPARFPLGAAGAMR